jgi:hypothetical protein
LHISLICADSVPSNTWWNRVYEPLRKYMYATRFRRNEYTRIATELAFVGLPCMESGENKPRLCSEDPESMHCRD